MALPRQGLFFFGVAKQSPQDGRAEVYADT
jgi:hypothetical protein